MKKFKFSLYKVKKYRDMLESIAENKYVKALGELRKEEGILSKMEMERADVLKNYDVTGNIDYDKFIAAGEFIRKLMLLMKIQREKIEEARVNAEMRLKEWTLAKRESEVIKKLEEKKYKAHMKEAELEEQKFIDEIFIAKKIREGM